MKRTLVAVALVIVFVMALAAPAFAQAITHSATYQLDGVINFKKQMGHLCNTGAAIKQTIMGSGQLDKVQTVSMIQDKITMKDANDGVAGATPLTITTVWELCAPPKVTYDAGLEMDYVPSAVELYAGGQAFFQKKLPWGGTAYGTPWDVVDAYDMDAVSSQIWAVQVQADAGYSIALHQDGVAANGPFGGKYDDYDVWLEDEGWTTKGADKDSDTWKYFMDEGAKVGADFVGHFFNIEQHARTSMGTLKRYIDISSPFSHGYLMEDMSVVGKSDVQETFSMVNAPQGADIVGDWWKLF